jgi:hypothetical protein
LHAGARRRGDPLLDLRIALWCPAGPLPQAFELTALGEDEQRKHRDAEQGGDRRYRPNLGERAR